MNEDIHKWTDGRYTLMFDEHTFFVFDNEREKEMTALEVTKKLNEQQYTIEQLQEDIIEMSDSHQDYMEMESETHSKTNDIIRTQRGKIFRLEKDNKRLKEKLQSVTDKQDEFLNEISTIFQKYGVGTGYNKRILEVALEEFRGGESEWNKKPFIFNSLCARKYHIRNVSPNGIVRLGNGHKAQWRMKDVRTIKNMLPPFEDFDAETFQEIKNKFHTKFDGNITGRIIYNIYDGTFEEWDI